MDNRGYVDDCTCSMVVGTWDERSMVGVDRYCRLTTLIVRSNYRRVDVLDLAGQVMSAAVAAATDPNKDSTIHQEVVVDLLPVYDVEE